MTHVLRRSRIQQFVASLMVIAILGVASQAFAQAPNAADVVGKFLAAIDGRNDLTAEQRTSVRAAVDRARQSPAGDAAAILAGLAAITPGLPTTLEVDNVSDDGRDVLRRLTNSPDPYVAATASDLLGRSLAFEGRSADALPYLVQVTDQWADRVPALELALIARAKSEAALLRRDEAIETCRRLLQNYAKLPTATRIEIAQQLNDLESIEPGSLDDIRDRMGFSGRQLAYSDTGKSVQGEQQRIIELLDALIERAKQSEGQGQGKGQKSGQGSGKGAGSGKPGSGGGEGPGKGGDDPTQGPAVRKLTRGGPQSPWGQLRDKQRDPAFSAIKEKLPARYQQLIEQYYKSFQEDRSEP